MTMMYHALPGSYLDKYLNTLDKLNHVHSLIILIRVIFGHRYNFSVFFFFLSWSLVILLIERSSLYLVLLTPETRNILCLCTKHFGLYTR